MTDGPIVNTDFDLWHGLDGDSIHVTEGGGIGINCGGYVIVKPLREWHKLASHTVTVPEVTNDMIDAAMDAAGDWFEIDGDKGAWLRSQGWEAAFKAMYAIAALPAPVHAGDEGKQS